MPPHSAWNPSIPYGIFLGEVQAILRFPFHVDSTWNGEITPFHVEFPLGIHVERLWNPHGTTMESTWNDYGIYGTTGLTLSHYLFIKKFKYSNKFIHAPDVNRTRNPNVC